MATPVSTALHQSPIVLIADDDADTREMYRFYLNRFGFEIEEAADGHQALAKTRVMLPDVVITDITLSGRDGFEVCREIRQDPRTATIPVIALTGYSRPGVADEARRAGFDIFLLKPSLPEQLLAQIRRLTRSVFRLTTPADTGKVPQ